MIKLITTSSYFELFNILTSELKGKVNNPECKNLVFCDDKATLMTERYICAEFVGSFNTEVFSFGKYLYSKKPMSEVLSKEGATMVIKKILSETPLNKLNRSKHALAPSMFDLIAQLKSAKITPEAVEYAAKNSDGVLSEKLLDIYSVYSAYDNFLKEKNIEDQNMALSHLPEIIEADDMSNTNVFLLGINKFTQETVAVIKSLINKAKNFTAILTEGKNEFAFVNETSNLFRKICKSLNKDIEEEKVKSDYSKEGKIIIDGLFNPTFMYTQYDTPNIHLYAAQNPADEADAVASTIKKYVMTRGLRYRDFTVVVSDMSLYRIELKKAFSRLDVPIFLDERALSPVNPLISLCESYINVFKYGLSLKTFTPFYKNPLVCSDRLFTDNFENYLLKHNVDWARLKKTLPNDGNTQYNDFEQFRKDIILYFDEFSLKITLEGLDVKKKLENNSSELLAEGENVISSVNSQIYDAIEHIIDEISEILGNTEISYAEYGRILSSGISALELSVIPQYNDAVFIGDFRGAALVKSKYLFVMGMTTSVPRLQEDSALLSDSDLDRLERIKVKIDPKIKIVNHRERESVALGLSAFSEELFVSYPIADFSGAKTKESEVLTFLKTFFVLKDFPTDRKYLTEKQGLSDFSRACGDYIKRKINDFTEATSFYRTTKNDDIKNILEQSNSEVKERLKNNSRVLTQNIKSPTAIEDFYKCPYYSFIKHGLNVKEKESGLIDGGKNGNLTHEIFKNFMQNCDTEKNRGFDYCFEKAVSDTIKSGKYASFFVDEESNASYSSMTAECKKFCKRFFAWMSVSKFTTKKSDTEVSFGDFKGAKYPAISLNGGKFKISGKIDRIDTYKDYFRIIDYKTGSANADINALYSGTKMQLYLYASVIKDKKLAGAYYLPISNEYKSNDKKEGPLTVGCSLDIEECLSAQDENLYKDGESSFIPVKIDLEKGKKTNIYDEKTMQSLVDYSLKISENATKELEDGVIVASPYDNVCEYCNFHSLCGRVDDENRSLPTINASDILEALESDENKNKEDKQ